MNPSTEPVGASLERRDAPGAIVLPEPAAAVRKDAKALHRVTASVSSEAAVLRGYGFEVLGHKPGEIDMSALQTGAVPLLADHVARTDSVLGRVERPRLEGGRLLVDLAFADHDAARAAAARVKAGELPNLSIGYSIERMEPAGERDGTPVFRATHWTPREVSLVAVPADFSVGVGRSYERQEGMEPNTNTGAKGTAPGALATRSAPAGEAAVLAERNRIAEIMALGKRFNMEDLADTAVREGVQLGDFRERIIANLGRDAAPVTLNRASAPGFFDDWGGHQDRAAVLNFSLTRALDALASGDRSKAGLEFEVSRTLEQAAKKPSRGIMVPPHALVPRAALTSASASGIAAITENYMASAFQDALRAESVIFQSGAQRLEGLSGDVRIPRTAAGLTGTWINEEDAAVESDMGLDTADLKPHTLSWMMRISRRALTQSALAMEEVVRRDIMAGIAESVDAAALVGSTDDAVVPRGLINTVGVHDVTVATENKPTWAEVIAFATAVAASNIEARPRAYIMHPQVRGYLMATPRVSTGDATMMMDAPDRLAGYRAFATTGMPSNNAGGGSLLFGDFSHLFVGLFGGIDILVDPYTYSDRGTTRIVAFSDWGVAVRRPEAFSRVKVA